MTRDALSAEGFGNVAVQVVQINNWFNDLYEQDTSNSYSGHVSWFGSFSGFFGNLLTLWRKENWSKAVVDAAEKAHFDSSDPIDSTAQAEAEWKRLALVTRAQLQRCAAVGDVEGALGVLGISLHALQDFYTHSNWVEPKGIRAATSGDGPGWAAMGTYGSHPTWFDVPASERAKYNIYSRFNGSPKVGHGDWNSPSRGSGELSMNKDWCGRPFHREAYVTAAIASRQWVQAARTWLNNEAFWRRMQAFNNPHGGELGHDQGGAFSLSWLVGHWNGNTGAKAMKLQIIDAGISYFEGRSKTSFRRKFETLIVPMMAPVNLNQPDPPVPNSRSIAAANEFVEAKITRLKQIDDIDGGDIIGENDADWYTKVQLYGQSFRSCLIDGHNSFSFPAPYAPMTFYKMVPKNRSTPTPLSNIRIILRTGTASGAGTDMDLFLRINDRTRFEFPYGTFDDFERGRNDTYTFALPEGTTLNDLQYIQLEKKGGGSWQFGGIRVEMNDLLIYRNDSVNLWMNKDSETWRAPSLLILQRNTTGIPISIQLWDDDYGLTGGDDQADICPFKGRKAAVLLFNPARSLFGLDATGTGKVTVRGGGDSDRAELDLTMAMVPVTAARLPLRDIGAAGRIGRLPGITVKPPPPGR